MPPSRQLVKAAKDHWKVRKKAAAAAAKAMAVAAADESSGSYDPNQDDGFQCDAEFHIDSVIEIESTDSNSSEDRHNGMDIDVEFEEAGYDDEDDFKSNSFMHILKHAAAFSSTCFERETRNLKRKKKLTAPGPGKGTYTGDLYWTQNRKHKAWDRAAKGSRKIDSLFPI